LPSLFGACKTSSYYLKPGPAAASKIIASPAGIRSITNRVGETDLRHIQSLHGHNCLKTKETCLAGGYIAVNHFNSLKYLLD
jgi:hypothetical protein